MAGGTVNLTPEQRRVLSAILRIGRKVHATPREIKANVETGLVESNLRNLGGGDADSAGYRQERASLYRDPTNLKHAIRRFYQEAADRRGQYARAGDLAAAVQRPAAQYRGRYQQKSGEAQALIRALSGNTHQAAASGSSTSTRTVGGVDNQKARGALIASFLQGGDSRFTTGTNAAGSETSDPLSFAMALRQLGDVAGHQVTTRTPAQHHPQRNQPAPAGGTGTGSFDGKKVAGWIAPILEYARQHGWKGTVSSGYRSYADQERIYDSGVRPAAVPGTSNHEGSQFPRGAVDVTDAQQLAQILARSPYRKRLRYAGSKDPVHFSHPHDGGY